MMTSVVPICTAFLALPVAIAAQSSRDPAAIAHAVDSLAQRVVADGIVPGVGVAVSMDGKTIYARSIGMADVTRRRSADTKTLWYLASTSKSFTGFGVSLLETQGILRFDDKIMALLPGVAWNPAVGADTLTLAHFLSHTHLINDEAIVMSAAFTGGIPERRWPQLIALAGRMPTADLVYSNFGYNVAAMVIDVKRPEGWRRYLDRAVFRPTGMRETYSRVSGLERRIAMPHRMNAEGRFVTETFQKADATMNSAGGHLATVGDLARWTIVQMDSGMIDGKRVFPAAAVERSHALIARHTREASRRFAYFDREGWGAGWDIGRYEGDRMVSRFGSYHSTRSHLSFIPSRRIGVVAMVSAGPSEVTDMIAAFAYDLDAGRSNARARAAERMDRFRATISAARRGAAARDSIQRVRDAVPLARPLSDYSGTYHNPAYGSITFSQKNRQLHYKWGVLSGIAPAFDAATGQFRLEIAGSGYVAAFLAQGGKVTGVDVRGVTFSKVK